MGGGLGSSSGGGLNGSRLSVVPGSSVTPFVLLMSGVCGGEKRDEREVGRENGKK